MVYRNNSVVAKTFYGVTFQPGETKEVPGYINSNDFDFVAKAPKQKEPPTSTDASTKSLQFDVPEGGQIPILDSEYIQKETKRKYRKKDKSQVEQSESQEETQIEKVQNDTSDDIIKEENV